MNGNLDKEEICGVVYNIQRYNLHDGPGIRTMIFLKGCPLHCPWCANPESQSFQPERMGEEIVGYTISAKEAIKRAARDQAFFKRSGGGITISGGELMAQSAFARALVLEAKKLALHVTLETAACVSWETFDSVAEQADVVLVDMKCMDTKLHLATVGMPNEMILENIERYAALGKEIIVRIPLIPQFNGNEKNLKETFSFCKKNGISEVHLLPYHEMGVSKYEKLGKPYTLSKIKPPKKSILQEMASQWEQEFGIVIQVL